ncbi:carboxypeptidase-like regulatory domain-containing protein [Winogradskyella sp. MIT101101]|uniref:carboxypeptidase-like regulatory domain-containing protein n=1 Tax=Winogradskyella sp. MIT101101 TaxID=3098297 RepID=UPI00399A5ACE
MKKLLALFTILNLLTACSKDQPYNLEAGNYSITGKFVTPNGSDAVSKASVKLYKDGTLVKEALTDSEGNFTLSELTKGNYELNIERGKFKTSTTVNLEDFSEFNMLDLDSILIEEIPSIAVVTGHWDRIEAVLYNIGLVDPLTQEPLFDIINGYIGFDRQSQYGHAHGDDTQNRMNPMLSPNVDFNFGEFIQNPDLLDDYDIIFLNCGLNESGTEFSHNLTDYINNGGLVYATDYAYTYLNDITANGSEYIDFATPYKSGTSLTAEAQILNQDLLDWIELNYNIDVNNETVTIDEFAPDWQLVDTYDAETVLPWLYSSVEYDGNMVDKYLAYTFLHGQGGVFYSSFHTENNSDDATTVDRLMQYMVFELADLDDEAELID